MHAQGPVCLQFARDGRCDRLEKTGSCKYSHDAEDVRKFNAASVLGREGIESIAKGLRQRQQGNESIAKGVVERRGWCSGEAGVV